MPRCIALADSGDLDQAEALAGSVTDPFWQAQALVALVEAVAGSGDLDRAEALAGSVTDPNQQAQAQVSMANSRSPLVANKSPHLG